MNACFLSAGHLYIGQKKKRKKWFWQLNNTFYFELMFSTDLSLCYLHTKVMKVTIYGHAIKNETSLAVFFLEIYRARGNGLKISIVMIKCHRGLMAPLLDNRL